MASVNAKSGGTSLAPIGSQRSIDSIGANMLKLNVKTAFLMTILAAFMTISGLASAQSHKITAGAALHILSAYDEFNIYGIELLTHPSGAIILKTKDKGAQILTHDQLAPITFDKSEESQKAFKEFLSYRGYYSYSNVIAPDGSSTYHKLFCEKNESKVDCSLWDSTTEAQQQVIKDSCIGVCMQSPLSDSKITFQSKFATKGEIIVSSIYTLILKNIRFASNYQLILLQAKSGQNVKRLLDNTSSVEDSQAISKLVKDIKRLNDWYEGNDKIQAALVKLVEMEKILLEIVEIEVQQEK